MARFILGILLVCLGLSALLGISLFKFAFAIILIVLGAIVISRGSWTSRTDHQTSSQEDFINDVAIFSPLNKVNRSHNFHGGKIVAIFSGGEIDLRGSQTSSKEINLEIVTIFAGVKVYVPKNWKVSNQSANIFGGSNLKTETDAHETTLNLKGVAIFGGVEITN